MPNLIALLTDFGEADPFAGVMKGVILTRHPKVQIVDLTHQIPAQDVRLGAFHLMTSVRYFPKDTLFVCVVDPGVGSDRRILWACSEKHQFLAPDNGILSWVEREEPLTQVREVSNQELFLHPVSTTFHGRDIFAPVAAELCKGLAPKKLGPCVESWQRLPYPQPRRLQGRIVGEVLAIDRFGNAVTNLSWESSHHGESQQRSSFRFKNKSVGKLQTHYAAAAPGAVLAIAASSGFVELCVSKGSFASKYEAKPGDSVERNDKA